MPKRKTYTKSVILRGLLTTRPGSVEWRKYYTHYRKTRHWIELRDKKLEQSPNCALCTHKAQDVHHRTYHYFAEKLTELTCLCSFHHRRTHGKK